jgi:hypothetical protein
MSTRIFDRDTLLDLTVNIIPLAIMAFFVVAFVVVDPWGDLGTFSRPLQLALLVVPLVALAVLTYVSGRAIAGAEKSGPVYPPGQATIPGTEELHHGEEEPVGAVDADDLDEPEALGEPTGEAVEAAETDETDETAETDETDEE